MHKNHAEERSDVSISSFGHAEERSDVSISERQFGNFSTGTTLALIALKCEGPHVGCKQPPQGDISDYKKTAGINPPRRFFICYSSIDFVHSVSSNSLHKFSKNNC